MDLCILIFPYRSQPIAVQYLVLRRGRAFEYWIMTRGGFWESDDFANRFRTAEDGDEAIEA